MKKFIVLFAVLLLLFTGCKARTHDNLTSETDSAEASAQLQPSTEASQPPEENSITPDTTKPAYHSDTEKYYDYFMENNHVGMLLSNETGGNGFSDAEMASYALCELIKISDGSYDSGLGFPKDAMDAISVKYFGTTIQNYENRATMVIPETGNITSTGWGGSSLAYVLKELTTEPDGIYTGVFYQFNFGMDVYRPSTKDDLLQGKFSDYVQPFLVKIIFEEKTDENGDMYLRYYGVKPEGEADPPYEPYQG